MIPGFEVGKIPGRPPERPPENTPEKRLPGVDTLMGVMAAIAPQAKELVSAYIEKLKSETKRNLAEAEKHNRTAMTLEQKTALLQEEAGHVESQRRELDSESKLRFEVAEATKAEALETRRQQLCADKAEALARMAEARARQVRAEAAEAIQRSRRPNQGHQPRRAEQPKPPAKVEAKTEVKPEKKDPEPTTPTHAQA